MAATSLIVIVIGRTYRKRSRTLRQERPMLEAIGYLILIVCVLVFVRVVSLAFDE